MADKAAGKSISLPKQKSASGLKLEADGKLPEMNLSNNCNSPAGGEEECTVREQDRFMPIANVIRIMRKILPPHAKIADDAKETIQECVSEYISFVTGEANERCQREQRKTITAEDVLWAMSKLGFDDYIEPLTVYLARFRDSEGGDQQRITSLRPLESQFMKRPNGVEYGGMGLQATYGGPPQYPHFAHAHHGHPNGYMNYFKDNNAGGSSGGSSGSGGSSMGNGEEYK